MTQLNIQALNDEEVEDLFGLAYEEQVGSLNNIGEFDCKCIRSSERDDIKVEVTIIGLAGSPTLDDYKNVTSDSLSDVVLRRADLTDVKFSLIPEATVVLNSNDYVVTYQAV